MKLALFLAGVWTGILMLWIPGCSRPRFHEVAELPPRAYGPMPAPPETATVFIGNIWIENCTFQATGIGGIMIDAERGHWKDFVIKDATVLILPRDSTEAR